MKQTHKSLLMGCLMVSATAIPASAQAVRSKYYPTNWTPPGSGVDFRSDAFIQDFSYAGYKRGESLPAPKDGEFTVHIKGGAADDTAEIQAAINRCSANGGGVVKFPTGTFRVSTGSRDYALHISSNKIILRGSGNGTTKIVNTTTAMNGKSVILFNSEGATSTFNTPVKLEGDHLRPHLSLRVTDASKFAVGDWVVVAWDFTQAWIDANGQSEWWNVAKGWGPKTAYYVRKIMSRDLTNDTVNINAPTRYAMLERDNARIWKIIGRTQESGIEHLAIGNLNNPATTGYGQYDMETEGTAAYDSHNSWLIKFQDTINCFARNVSSFDPEGTGDSHMLSNGIGIKGTTAFTTFSKISMQRPQYGGGGNGYMFGITGCENLLVDCTARYSRHGFSLTGPQTSGNVLLRCDDYDSGWQAGSPAKELARTDGYGSDTHGDFTHSNLWDSCSLQNSQWEAFHRGTISGNAGVTSAHGVFWNLYGGPKDRTHWNTNGYCVTSSQMKYGYVIGTSGITSEANVGSGNGTLPVDIKEHQGRGADLVPQSLYADQKAKRTARE